MKAIFSEYGRVMIAILVAVAFLVILFAGSYFKDGLAEPFKKDTSIEHEENEDVFAEISKKSLPYLVIGNQKIAKDEVFNPYSRVKGVCYIVDYFGDYQYETDEDGNYLYETDYCGNYILDENGNRQKKKTTDPDNIPDVNIATTDEKSVVEVDGEDIEGVTEIYDITFKAKGTDKFVLVSELSSDIKISISTEKPTACTEHPNTVCDCGITKGTITEEENFNTPGILRVRYRLTDKNNAETFVDVNYIIEDYLNTIEDGALIGGRS